MNISGYVLPTNLQNFTQEDLTKVKTFKKVLVGATFLLRHPVDHNQDQVVTLLPEMLQGNCTEGDVISL